MTSKSNDNSDNQLLLDILLANKKEEYNLDIIQSKIEILYSDFVNLYNSRQKNAFYKWIEKGSEEQLNKVETFINLVSPKLIDKKFHKVFDLAEEVIIPKNVITKIINKLTKMFEKGSKTSTTNSVVVPLDEEGTCNSDKSVEYLKHIKTEMLLCDDEDIRLMDHLIYKETDHIDNGTKKLREMFEEEIFTDEEIYTKTLGISPNMKQC